MRKNSTLAALAVGALLFASCGVSREPTASGSGPAAATIEFADGSSEVVARSELDDLIETTTANDDFVALVYQGTVPAGFEAVVLSQAVIGEVLQNELEELGAEPTDEDVEMARSLLLQDLEQMTLASSDPNADPEQYFEDVSYLPFIVNLQAQQLALSSALAADAPDGTGDPCVRHILLEDEAAADEVVVALEGGADFATLAMERSTGPTGPDGGNLGCAPATNYVPEFGEAVLSAEVGQFVGPVETQFGFHVILVEGYEVNGDVLVDAALATGLAEIDVTVDEEIGVWDTDQRIVVPAQPTP